MILVSGATAAIRKYAPHPNLGCLLTPVSRNSVRWLESIGLPWAADNAAFAHFRPRQFLAMVGSLIGTSVRWVAAPDVVADAPATLARFAIWQPVLAELGLPVALVAQDGLTPPRRGRLARPSASPPTTRPAARIGLSDWRPATEVPCEGRPSCGTSMRI